MPAANLRKVAMTDTRGIRAALGLPIHPRTGLQAIGWCKRGPIWPVMGGSGEGDPPADPPADPAPKPADPAPAEPPKPSDAPKPAGQKADEPLGDGGTRALAAEREARKAESEARKAAEKAAADASAQLEQLKPLTDLFAQIRKTAMPDAEKSDLERLTERLATQEQATADERMARWRVEVASEKGLTKKQAARLQGKTYDELAADADDLLETFPKPADPPKDPAGKDTPPAKPAPKPDPSQGSRGDTPTRSTSLMAAVSKAMASPK